MDNIDPAELASALLEDATAKLPTKKAEIRILPARGLDLHHDVVLISDHAPLYIGTIAPKHSVWRVIKTAPNVGRAMRTQLHWHMPTKEECAIRMSEVMRPYWKPIINSHGLEETEDAKDFVADVPVNYRLGYLYYFDGDDNDERYQKIGDYPSLAAAYTAAINGNYHKRYLTYIEVFYGSHAEGKSLAREFQVTEDGDLVDTETHEQIDISESSDPKEMVCSSPAMAQFYRQRMADIQAELEQLYRAVDSDHSGQPDAHIKGEIIDLASEYRVLQRRLGESTDAVDPKEAAQAIDQYVLRYTSRNTGKRYFYKIYDEYKENNPAEGHPPRHAWGWVEQQAKELPGDAKRFFDKREAVKVRQRFQQKDTGNEDLYRVLTVNRRGAKFESEEDIDPKAFVNSAFGPLRTLKDLQKYDNEQAFWCNDPVMMKDYDMTEPFKVWDVHWLGGGLVSGMFYHGDYSYPRTAVTPITHLKPVLMESDEHVDPKEFVNDTFKYVYIVREADRMDAWLAKSMWPTPKLKTAVTGVFRNKQTALNYASNLGGRAYRVSENSPIVKAWIATGQPIRESTKAEIEAEAEKAEKPASDEQAEAGNYKKGHVSVQGLDIAIENAKGSTRSGVNKAGEAWKVTLPAHYGYIKGTVGKDKDHLDVYIGDNPGGMLVFVVNQQKEEGGFDEHKIMLGFASKDEAISTYDRAFTGDLGPKLRESVVSTTMDNLKDWLKSGNTKKPFESIAESIVDSLLENDDPKELAMSIPPAPRLYGQLQPGTVLYDETGAYSRVEKIERSYSLSNYQDEDGKLVYDSGPCMAVRLTEFSPAYAYGRFTQPEMYNVKAALLGAEVVSVEDNSDDALWALVDADIDRRMGEGRAAREREAHLARQAARTPEQVDADRRYNEMMGRDNDA